MRTNLLGGTFMKKLKRFVCLLILSSLVCGNINSYAVDNKSSIKISVENEALIKNALQEQIIDQSCLDQFNKFFFTNIQGNNDDYNCFLEDHISSIVTAYNNNNSKLIQAQKMVNENIENKSLFSSNGSIAEELYSLGISKVENKGCPMTASYMRWARDAKGGKKLHDGDAWAKSCIVQELNQDIFPKFEEEILATGKEFGVINGTFAYNTSNSSLDHFAALHAVSYSVSFAKAAVGYNALYYIYDVYDFDWMTYDNFEIGFGNNYCKMMQDLGLIYPFPIEIRFYM